MHKKEHQKNKRTIAENQVEDIYGVHFKYQDLFSRLLKVQKQRQKSEEKNSFPRMPSYDSNLLRHFSTGKGKKDSFVNKKSSSISNLHQKTILRTASVKKITMLHPASDQKKEIFKSYSPNTKRPKRFPSHPKSGKKFEKKASMTIRISKKTLLKAKDLKISTNREHLLKTLILT